MSDKDNDETESRHPLQLKLKQIACLHQFKKEEDVNNLIFKVVEIAPLPGERILTTLDAAIQKIHLFTLIPSMGQLMMQMSKDEETGKSVRMIFLMKEMEKAFGEEFFQDLAHLGSCQWTWKMLQIERSEPTLHEETLQSQEDKNQIKLNSNPQQTTNSPMAYHEATFPTTDNNPLGMQLSNKPKPEDKKRLLVSILQQDKSKITFFKDLLKSPLFIAESKEKDTVDTDPLTTLSLSPSCVPCPSAMHITTSPTTATTSIKQSKKLSTIKLLKLGLKGRYASHIRQCLKERDTTSLLCILSILAESQADYVSKFSYEMSKLMKMHGTNAHNKNDVPSLLDTKAIVSIDLSLQGKNNEDVEILEEQDISKSSDKDDQIDSVRSEQDPETLIRTGSAGCDDDDDVKDLNTTSELVNVIDVLQDKDASSGVQGRESIDEHKSKYIFDRSVDSSQLDEKTMIFVDLKETREGTKGPSLDHERYSYELDTPTSSQALDEYMFETDISSEQVSNSNLGLNEFQEAHPICQICKKRDMRNVPLLNEQITSSLIEMIESRIRFIYKKLIKNLMNCPSFMSYLEKVLNQIKIHEQNNERETNKLGNDPQNCYELDPISPNCLIFLETTKLLKMITRSRFILPGDEKKAKDKDVLICSRNLQQISRRVVDLEDELSRMRTKSDYRLEGLVHQIRKLEKELEEENIQSSLEVLEEVKGYETEKVIQQKKHQLKITEISLETQNATERLDFALKTLDMGYKGLKKHRKELENQRNEAIKEYDVIMSQLQEILDKLYREERKKSRDIKKLEADYRMVEEQFEEMKTIRRLREILQNSQMVESVRKNWAAKRIQDAWQRYKALQLKKRRLKKGRGRKTGKKKDAGNAAASKKKK